MKYRSIIALLGMGLAWGISQPQSVHAQGTAFTYQGSLNSGGSPANGLYSLRFILRPAPGSSSQMGALTNAPVGVTNGLFTTIVDFGNVFATSPLYLEIGVRTNGSTGAFTVLSPTNLITSVPYAVQALQAQSSSTFLGAIADSQLSTNIANLSSNQIFTGQKTFSNATGFFNGTLSGTFSGAATGTYNGTGFFNGTNTGTFIGNGAGVTNLSLTNLVGVILSNANWQIVQSSPQQGAVQNNYIFTNNTQQSLVLPTSPSVGNTVWLSGVGAAGWKLSQSGSQSVITTTLGLPAGQLWTAASTSQSYKAVTSSANGIYIAAAPNTGIIEYSHDGGLTWANSDSGSIAWMGIASSLDGNRMAACGSTTRVYTSTNGGVNWVSQSGSANLAYGAIACSANGYNIAAAPHNNFIQISTDGGTNWSSATNAPNAFWTGICSSQDGNTLAAVGSTTRIYVSKNSGVNWATNGPASGFSYSCIACSADGTFMLAGVNTGFLYVSGDGGNTWSARLTSQGWNAVACSANGKNMVAAYGSAGYIYCSQDYGATWTQRSNGYSSAQNWTCLASSADGSRLIGGISTGQLWISTAATTVGSTGYIIGSQYSNLQLQYAGNNTWFPLSFAGSFTAN